MRVIFLPWLGVVILLVAANFVAAWREARASRARDKELAEQGRQYRRALQERRMPLPLVDPWG